MNKIKEKIIFKDKKVYVPIIIIIIILVLFGISNYVSKLSNSKEKKFSSNAKEVEFIDNLADDSNRKEFSISASSEKGNCSNNICVENVNVMCYEKRGIINFIVKNNSSISSGGYLNLTVGNYSAVIWYDNIAPGESYSGFHSYEGYKINDSSSYYVNAINDDDKTAISTFKYYSCLNNRNYYEVDFEGNRVFREGDEDYKRSSCIYRKDSKREVSFVDHYFNPCETLDSSDPDVIVVNQCEFASNCVENSSGQCVNNGTGGDIESNKCVQYTIVENGEINTFCGKRDDNGYINHTDENKVTKTIKCNSYALCVEDGCFPFCEDLLAKR